MLFNLIQSQQAFLAEKGLWGWFRVWTYIEFRCVLAILLGFVLVVVFGRRTILWLIRQKIGDNPEFYRQDLNKLMQGKANTPTMGGILISGSIAAVVCLLADMTNFYIHMALVCLVCLSAVGFVDDWLKLTTARRKPGSREGLRTWEKLLFQFGLAVILGIFIHHHGQNKLTMDPLHHAIMSHSLTLPLAKTWVFDVTANDWRPATGLIVLGTWPFVLLTTMVIAGSSNAVNLTDGMDGLASGTVTIASMAMLMLALIAGFDRNEFILAKYLLVPYIPFSEELAVVAGGMVGACLGFLWFNCWPAQVFMGDTGSLPLGGLLGYIAVVIRQEFLLVIIGGIFVAEALSVLIQVSYFKYTKGKRLFRCAPIHHHFHLAGWAEQQVVVRFWLIGAILAAIGLLTIKLR
jgi:phospho-N-acetylmuramoyl-pentapeptide-transferase